MRDSLGVEIGSGGVRAARLSLSKQPELNGFGQAPLPQGAVQDGEIADPQPVAKAISDAVKAAGRSKRLTVAVANQKVVARIAELPYMAESDLRGSLRYQVQDLIPIPLESAVLDYQVLGEFTNDDQERMVRVLVVAAQKEMINSFLDALSEAGFSPEAIDFAPLALLRSVPAQENGSLAVEGEALIDVGTELTSMVVRHGDVPRLARVLAVGGNQDPETLVDEIRGSIKFYTGQSEDGAISRAILSGEAGDLETIAPVLADALRVPVEVGSYLGRLKASKGLSQRIKSQRQEPLLAVPVGAALGAVGS